VGGALARTATRPRKAAAVFLALLASAVLVPGVHIPDAAATEAPSSIIQVPAMDNATGSPPSCTPPTTGEVAGALAQAASGAGPEEGSPGGPLVNTEGAIASNWTRAVMAHQFPRMIDRGDAGCVVLCVVIPDNVSWTTTTLVAKDRFSALGPFPSGTTDEDDGGWSWEPSDTVRHAYVKDTSGKPWPVAFICRQFRNWKQGSKPMARLVVKYVPDADNLSLLAGIWCGSAPDNTPLKLWWSILDGARAKITVLNPPGSPPESRTVARHLHNVFFTYRPLQNPTTYNTWTWDAPHQRMIVSKQTPVSEQFPKGPGRNFVRCDYSTMSVSNWPYLPDGGPGNP